MNVLERNNVQVLGDHGPVLLYAHGFGCNQNMWSRITPAFAATHRQVVFDYVGSGTSDLASFDARRYATLDGYAQDVLDACDALGLESGVSFVGHSVSGSIGLFVLAGDITVLKHAGRNRHLALHDALTDLPNRALMTERLGQLLNLTKREKRSVAVMFLDLDRFKAVNDTYGHAVGDALLKAVATRLRSLVRETDTVARLGGDEFVILLDNPASDDEVARIAARIVASLGEPKPCGGKLVQIGTSIGIARYPIEGETPSDLIRNADAAMYAAKSGGKNTFRFFSANPIRLPIDTQNHDTGVVLARMDRAPLEARARSA